MTTRMWNAALAMALAYAAFGAFAQKLDEPLRFVVGYAPGGASDHCAGAVASGRQAAHPRRLGDRALGVRQGCTAAALKAYKTQWEPVVKRSGYQQ